MEAIEFWVIPDGQVCYKRNGTTKVLTISDRDIVEYVISMLHDFFPDTLIRLRQLAADSQLNKYKYEFLMAERFIRCNFGENDTMVEDIANGRIHFEEVRCPLRGICPDQGVICKPQPSALQQLKPAQREVLYLYSMGYEREDIAGILKKSCSTISNQLENLRQKFKCNSTKDLRKLRSITYLI